ncbi:MAG: pantetheine-phosphate adenylyltransferase [Bacteroidota bacterium]
MKKIAVFPGSFDPITVGHVDIVLRSLSLFDEIIIAVGINSQKNSLYSLEKRLHFLHAVFDKYPQIKIEHFEGLTIHFCKDRHAQYIIRGIRSAADFEYEKTIAHLNNEMEPGIETILMLTKSNLGHISSTIVREILRGKGDVHKFVPEEIVSLL